MKLKEFNLKEALAGKPVCTRGGKSVRIVCFDKLGNQPIVALIRHSNTNDNEDLHCFNNNGSYINSAKLVNDDYDLFMAPVKTKYYVHIYKSNLESRDMHSVGPTIKKWNEGFKGDLIQTLQFEIEE